MEEAMDARAMDVPIEYCTTSDSVRIGYAVAGEGPPLILVMIARMKWSELTKCPFSDPSV